MVVFQEDQRREVPAAAGFSPPPPSLSSPGPALVHSRFCRRSLSSSTTPHYFNNMGERKVLNKYYPPDFDPAKIPRAKAPKEGKMNVRMMVPMSIQCNTCGEYIYKGKKFNSKKETVEGEEYLGIKIFRFYFRCTQCSSQLTIKTDPKRADYVTEWGCSRNFEPWRATEDEKELEKQEREAEEEGDAMKALENRTEESKREMDILDALDEMRQVNARLANVDTQVLLDEMSRLRESAAGKKAESADEKLLRAFKKRAREQQRKAEKEKLRAQEVRLDDQTFKRPNPPKKQRKSRFVVVKSKPNVKDSPSKVDGSSSSSSTTATNEEEESVGSLAGLLDY